MAVNISKIIKELNEIKEVAENHPMKGLLKVMPTKKQTEKLFQLAKDLYEVHLGYESHKLAEKYRK